MVSCRCQLGLVLAILFCALAVDPVGADDEGVPRLDGLQVWPVEYGATVRHGDVYGPNLKKIQSVSIVGVRNGVFSGRIIATCSTAPIKGLKAKASDLVTEDGKGKIPATQVAVRFAQRAIPTQCLLPPYRYDGLLDAAPSEISTVQVSARDWRPKNDQPLAMMPVWITVRIPADAPAGEYRGTVTVQADDNPALPVPVQLKVHDVVLPSPKDFRVHQLDFHSAESVAMHYSLPLWSEKHFEYMGKSLSLMAEVGARRVWMDLCINFAGHNAESVIRWIKNDDGTYSHDFSVFDKYLDMVDKSIGKPLPLRLNCWGQIKKDKEGVVGWYGPTKVSLLDPATKKVTPMDMPKPTADMKAVEDFWKPALLEARKRIDARGWFDVTCLGHNEYCGVPTAETVSMAARIWPDGVWANTSHGGSIAVYTGADKKTTMRCLYGECVWNEGNLTPRGIKGLLARDPKNGLSCGDARCRHGENYNRTDTHVYRDLPEEQAMRGHDGVGQLGVDFFPVKWPNGRVSCLGNDRGGTGPTNSTQSLLAPGPNGPIATERYEFFRESVQVTELLIQLERALAGKKITGDLAAKVNTYLTARGERFIVNWRDYHDNKVVDSPEKRARMKDYLTGLQQRDEGLFALATEVAKALAAQ